MRVMNARRAAGLILLAAVAGAMTFAPARAAERTVVLEHWTNYR